MYAFWTDHVSNNTTEILVTQYYISQPNHKDCNQYISIDDMIECLEIHYSEPNSNDRSQPKRKIGTNSDLTCTYITKSSTTLYHNVTLLNLWTKSQSINQIGWINTHYINNVINVWNRMSQMNTWSINKLLWMTWDLFSNKLLLPIFFDPICYQTGILDINFGRVDA